MPLGASLGALLSNSRHQTKLLFGTGPKSIMGHFFLISLILSVMILYTPPGVIFRLVHPRAELKTRPLIMISKILFKYPVLLVTPIYFLCHNQGQDYGAQREQRLPKVFICTGFAWKKIQYH